MFSCLFHSCDPTVTPWSLVKEDFHWDNQRRLLSFFSLSLCFLHGKGSWFKTILVVSFESKLPNDTDLQTAVHRLFDDGSVLFVSSYLSSIQSSFFHSVEYTWRSLFTSFLSVQHRVSTEPEWRILIHSSSPKLLSRRKLFYRQWTMSRLVFVSRIYLWQATSLANWSESKLSHFTYPFSWSGQLVHLIDDHWWINLNSSNHSSIISSRVNIGRGCG